MRLRFVVCEFWGVSGGLSRLRGSSTARRGVGSVPPAHFSLRTFLVRVLKPRDVSLSGRVFAGRGFSTSRGSSRARRRSSWRAHGSSPGRPGPGLGEAKPLSPQPPSLLFSVRQALERAGNWSYEQPGAPLRSPSGQSQTAARAFWLGVRATTSLFVRPVWGSDPSPDPCEVSLPTGRVFFGVLGCGSSASSKLPNSPPVLAQNPVQQSSAH